MTIVVEIADLSAPGLAALVARHTQFCDGTAPAESCHRYDIDALAAKDLTVWQARSNDLIVGMCALKVLSDTAGEIKSMHTLDSARGKGVARKLLATLMDAAQSKGMQTLWLETGVHPDFAAARALYAAHGFNETGPFADYVLDPHSTFMTRSMTPELAT